MNIYLVPSIMCIEHGNTVEICDSGFGTASILVRSATDGKPSVQYCCIEKHFEISTWAVELC